MGKYFKEDNNQRFSQFSEGVDVNSLVKRLIIAQAQLFKTRPTIIPEGVMPGGGGWGTKTQRLDPGSKGKKYVTTPVVSGLAKLAEFFMPAKIKLIKQLVEGINATGGLDVKLSKKFDNDLLRRTLNKEYLLQIHGKSASEPVQLRDLIYRYDPITGKLSGKAYAFTDKQIAEMYRDLNIISDQANKWAVAKSLALAGAAGAVGTGINIEQAIERGKPETKQMRSDVESIMNKQQSTIDDSANPLDKKKGK